MNSNVINFYIKANELKNVLRTGWAEVGISSERAESVAESIYGTMVLAVALDGEYQLGLDMYKVMKMFLVKGLEKINLMKEFTPRNYPTPEERNENSRRIIADLTKGLINETEYMELFEEYQKQESKEARFCLQVAKIESDLQAKIYDLKGQFDVEKAKEDAKYFDNADEIIPQISNASDSWILFDRRYYVDELFKNLSQDIQNLRSL